MIIFGTPPPQHEPAKDWMLTTSAHDTNFLFFGGGDSLILIYCFEYFVADIIQKSSQKVISIASQQSRWWLEIEFFQLMNCRFAEREKKGINFAEETQAKMMKNCRGYCKIFLDCKTNLISEENSKNCNNNFCGHYEN